VRDSVSTLLGARLTVLRDSILTVLQNDTVKMAPRLMKTLRAQKTQAIGCFGKSRVMIFVAQYAGDFEYYHQVAALVDTA
jgi:tetrahydromethanopterin S-methyltransferase subunit C